MNQVAYINLQGHLEIASLGNHEKQVIRHGQRRYQFPTWSPDGRYIAVINHDEQAGYVSVIEPRSTTGDHRDLYQSAIDRPFYLYWSPSSRQLAFLAAHQKGGIGLHCVSPLGGYSKFMATGQPFFCSWDGHNDNLLLHYGGRKQTPSLKYLELSNLYESQNVADPGPFQAPGISASGHYWAFATRDGRQQPQLTLQDRSRLDELRFSHQGAIVFNWSPTAESLAYITPSQARDGFYGPLYLVEMPAGQRRQLVDETVLAFNWSPDGQKIAYFTMVDSDLDPHPGRRIIREGYAAGRSLPDDTFHDLWLNLWVIDVTSGRSRLLTPFKPTDTFVRQFLPFFDQFALSHRIWSPDSTHILISADRNGEPTVTAVPINGLAPIEVDLGEMAVWQPG